MGTGQDYYSCVFSVLLLALEKMIDKLRRNISGYEKLDDIYNINYKKIQSNECHVFKFFSNSMLVHPIRVFCFLDQDNLNLD